MYKYYIYGARIASDERIKQNNIVTFNMEADIKIHNIKDLTDINLRFKKFKATSTVEGIDYLIHMNDKEIFIFHNKKCIFYIVSDSKDIYYNYADSVYESLILLIAQLMKEKYIYIHSSAFMVNDKAYALIAKSGIGKSNTLFEILKKGAAYITDDQLPVRVEKNKCIASPSSSVYPRFTVNSLKHYKLKYNSFIKVIKFHESLTDKYYVPLKGVAKCNKEVKIDTAFLLTPVENTNTVTISPFNKKRVDLYSIVELHLDTNNYFLSKNRNREMVNNLSQVIDCIKFYEIRYKKSFSNLSNIVDHILTFIAENKGHL